MTKEMAKFDWRQHFLLRRRNLCRQVADRACGAIVSRLLALSELNLAQEIAAYCAIFQEVNLKQAIAEYREQGKTVLLPRYNVAAGEYEMVEVENIDRDTVPGRFGIFEPRPEIPARPGSSLVGSRLAWLIPGVGFDLTGTRLGRGAGFYDRLLNAVSGLKIGVAYDWQIVDSLPSQEHDQKMNMIISEKRVLRMAS